MIGWLRTGGAAALMAVALGAGTPALAQNTPGDAPTLRVPRAPILTIDASRLLPETVVGQRLVRALEAEGAALERENRAIAQALRDEELALTEQRDSLEREEFLKLAEDFDARVQAARREQDAKQAALQARLDDQQQALMSEIRPILGQIMIEANAAMIMEIGTVMLSVRSIDITDIAIARINATLAEPDTDPSTDPDTQPQTPDTPSDPAE